MGEARLVYFAGEQESSSPRGTSGADQAAAEMMAQLQTQDPMNASLDTRRSSEAQANAPDANADLKIQKKIDAQNMPTSTQEVVQQAMQRTDVQRMGLDEFLERLAALLQRISDGVQNSTAVRSVNNAIQTLNRSQNAQRNRQGNARPNAPATANAAPTQATNAATNTTSSNIFTGLPIINLNSLRTTDTSRRGTTTQPPAPQSAPAPAPTPETQPAPAPTPEPIVAPQVVMPPAEVAPTVAAAPQAAPQQNLNTQPDATERPQESIEIPPAGEHFFTLDRTGTFHVEWVSGGPNGQHRPRLEGMSPRSTDEMTKTIAAGERIVGSCSAAQMAEARANRWLNNDYAIVSVAGGLSLKETAEGRWEQSTEQGKNLQSEWARLSEPLRGRNQSNVMPADLANIEAANAFISRVYVNGPGSVRNPTVSAADRATVDSITRGTSEIPSAVEMGRMQDRVRKVVNESERRDFEENRGKLTREVTQAWSTLQAQHDQNPGTRVESLPGYAAFTAACDALNQHLVNFQNHPAFIEERFAQERQGGGIAEIVNNTRVGDSTLGALRATARQWGENPAEARDKAMKEWQERRGRYEARVQAALKANVPPTAASKENVRYEIGNLIHVLEIGRNSYNDPTLQSEITARIAQLNQELTRAAAAPQEARDARIKEWYAWRDTCEKRIAEGGSGGIRGTVNDWKDTLIAHLQSDGTREAMENASPAERTALANRLRSLQLECLASQTFQLSHHQNLDNRQENLVPGNTPRFVRIGETIAAFKKVGQGSRPPSEGGFSHWENMANSAERMNADQMDAATKLAQFRPEDLARVQAGQPTTDSYGHQWTRTESGWSVRMNRT